MTGDLHLPQSAASAHHDVLLGGSAAAVGHFALQHEQLREENQRLLTQIVDVQKNFQVSSGSFSNPGPE